MKGNLARHSLFALFVAVFLSAAQSQECPANYTAATSSGYYVLYFGDSDSGGDCCASNELAISCGIDVLCSDPAIYDDSFGALAPYSSCGTSRELLVGSDNSGASTTCDEAMQYVQNVANQSDLGCDSDQFSVARRQALALCGNQAYLCMAQRVGGICGDNTTLVEVDSTEAEDSEVDCPPEYVAAKESGFYPLYLGSSTGFTNQTCCERYQVESSCGLDVLCPNPAGYNQSYGELYTYISCATSGQVLVGLDGASTSLSCDDAVAYAWNIYNQTGCDSDEYTAAIQQAQARCGYQSLECIGKSVYGGFCDIGVPQEDVSAYQCFAAAQNTAEQAQEKGCASDEYMAALSETKALCRDDAETVLAATVGNACPYTCQSALNNLRAKASTFYTSCGTNDYNYAAQIVVNLCGPDVFIQINQELCAPKPSSCEVALDNAIQAAQKYGCASSEWSEALATAKSACPLSKVAAAMANAGVDCPITCSQAIHDLKRAAYWPGCFTFTYYQASKVAINTCGWFNYFIAVKENNICQTSPSPSPPQPPPPPPSPPSRLCSTNIVPNGPSNLRVTQLGSTSVDLCWYVAAVCLCL